MASDFDLDWGDDPFGGDVDFDMDFNMDPFKGKGFIRSVATGFLSGVVDETVGSGDARMRSLRTILPSTFSTALDKASFVGDRLKDLATEFREENAESAKSLQTIASHLNQKMGRNSQALYRMDWVTSVAKTSHLGNVLVKVVISLPVRWVTLTRAM